MIEYSGSAVNAVSSGTCVEPLPRIKISCFLLLIRTDELISATNITTFLSKLPFGNENVLPTSNEIPYPEKEYLSRSYF